MNQEQKCPVHPDITEEWTAHRVAGKKHYGFVCPQCEEDLLNHEAGDCGPACRWCASDRDRTVPEVENLPPELRDI